MEIGEGEEAVKGCDEGLDLWVVIGQILRDLYECGCERLTRNHTMMSKMRPM